MFIWNISDVITIIAIVIAVMFGMCIFISTLIEDLKNKFKKTKD